MQLVELVEELVDLVDGEVQAGRRDGRGAGLLLLLLLLRFVFKGREGRLVVDVDGAVGGGVAVGGRGGLAGLGLVLVRALVDAEDDGRVVGLGLQGVEVGLQAVGDAAGLDAAAVAGGQVADLGEDARQLVPGFRVEDEGVDGGLSFFLGLAWGADAGRSSFNG